MRNIEPATQPEAIINYSNYPQRTNFKSVHLNDEHQYNNIIIIITNDWFSLYYILINYLGTSRMRA